MHGNASPRTRLVQSLVAYASTPTPPENEFVVPDDLSTLSDEALTALHDQAIENFNALYGDPAAEGASPFSDDDLTALGALTEAIERLGVEMNERESKNVERADAAAALAARVNPADTEGDPEEDDADADADEDADEDEDAGDGDGEADADAEATDKEPVLVAAGRRGDTRVDLRGINRRQRRTPKPSSASSQGMRDFAHAADVPGFSAGQSMEWADIGRALERRLASYNHGAYSQAHRTGKRITDRAGVVNLNRNFDEALTIRSADPDHVESVIRHAIDHKRLPKGSLTASGGWCAPSETLYGFCELESDDGMLSVPEVSVARGGIKFTTGPSWSDIFGAGAGWDYSEQNDIDGDYGTDANGVGDGSEGDKECYTVPCPDFEEARLRVAGICISAGLLQARGYPEALARVTRGALTAYRHKMNARIINSMVAQSTAVAGLANTAGAAAPLLTAVELQVEHYKYVNRMSRSAVLEAVFPYWVHGAIRSDLALRLGVNLLDVSNTQIDTWFRDRGVNPQFVYDWQDITGAAGAFTSWPNSVTFLLYSAGTFLKGTSDVISIDTMYDSTLLAQNDFTALFFEEGYFVAKTCEDSRAVTVPLCADGATAAGILIDCDGAVSAT